MMKKFRSAMIVAIIVAINLAVWVNEGFSQRVSMAEEEFQNVLSKTPSEKVKAAMFFSKDMVLEDVQETLRGTPLAVKGFRHGSALHSGGYTLQEGETLNEAISNYRRDHLSFIEERERIEKDTFNKESDAGLRNAIKKSLQESSRVKADFKKNGLRIIGVEVEGSAKDMENYRKSYPFVGTIELTKNGRPQPAILPVQ